MIRRLFALWRSDPHARTTAGGYRRLSLGLLLAGLIALALADIELHAVSPAEELARIGMGLLQPSLAGIDQLWLAIAQTIAFALLGLGLGAALGLLLATRLDNLVVRGACAWLRAVHELFWALLFLQLFGFSPLTGILAIALPYAGIFARVYHDILAQADPRPQQLLPGGTGRLSAFLYTRICACWEPLASYTRYRFECALRSATVLGFIGLPTLGFHLESAFKEGHYAQAGALLWIFFALIASQRWWLRWQFLPLYLVMAWWSLPSSELLPWQYAWRFLSEDIVPSPLRYDGWAALWPWLGQLWQEQIRPGIGATVLLTLAATLVAALVTLLLLPLGSHRLAGLGVWPGRGLLIALRSTPEMLLTFIGLLLLGPSMLPAIAALALHNGALMATLLARNCDQLRLRLDAPSGAAGFFYDILPRLYQGFLAFLFYRSEVIMRESAILGILGITTLGFYVDSAFEDLRFDVALVLIAVTAMLNILVDNLSALARRRLAIERLQRC